MREPGGSTGVDLITLVMLFAIPALGSVSVLGSTWSSRSGKDKSLPGPANKHKYVLSSLKKDKAQKQGSKRALKTVFLKF